MGNHFIPQAYLRAFEPPDAPGMIWVYPRKGAPRLGSIAKVAQSADFYTPDVEIDLERLIERPAGEAFRRLHALGPLPEGHRHVLSVYIATMITRVPARRRKGEDMLPGVIRGTIARISADLRALSISEPGAAEIVERRLAEIAEIERKYLAEPPDVFLEHLRLPWPSQSIVQAVETMTWRVAIADGPDPFITTDNPAFFFESLGLRNETSELAFPVSPALLLHGSRQPASGGLGPQYLKVRPAFVKEMNRRLASGATSIALADRRLPWVLKLLANEHPNLNRIEWN